MRKLLKHQSRRLLDLFRQWDTDGSNTLSQDEFEKAMSMFGAVRHAQDDVLVSVATIEAALKVANALAPSYSHLRPNRVVVLAPKALYV